MIDTDEIRGDAENSLANMIDEDGNHMFTSTTDDEREKYRTYIELCDAYDALRSELATVTAERDAMRTILVERCENYAYEQGTCEHCANVDDCGCGVDGLRFELKAGK